jgi:hypothetical protein
MSPPDSVDATLPASERTRCIAELLVKAILLANACEAVPPSAEGDNPIESAFPDDRYPEDARIVRYLEVVGQAPPGVIREALGLPKTSAYRAFLRLTAGGRIASAGRSRGIAYSLVEREPPPDKIGLN